MANFSDCPHIDIDSDYGPDFTVEEEAELDVLVESLTATTGLGFPLGAVDGAHGHRQIISLQTIRKSKTDETGNSSQGTKTPEAEELERKLGKQRSLESNESRSRRVLSGERLCVSPLTHEEDSRSPLERFRTLPKKPLSVTDLVSPSWCELQYFYNLSKYGRKRATAAMRQGSIVHQSLENEVHKKVEITVESKEDAFALRILNVIQGLKALRHNGLTRELEVWGILEGQVVNGIIDELSYVCPDKELEIGECSEDIRLADEREQATKMGDTNPDDSVQKAPERLRSISSMRKRSSKIYISDVKVRTHKSIPKGASFRPTLYQLMLYHRLLAGLAENKILLEDIAARYELDVAAVFSDNFVSQVGNLSQSHYDMLYLYNEKEISRLHGPISILMDDGKVNSLRKLWEVMLYEFRLTMPGGSKSLGSVLKAEYRDVSHGSIIGIKTFCYSEDLIMKYLQDEMKWWRGERPAQGVCIEEAYKCRSCEWATSCEWRLARVDEDLRRHRSRTRSAV